MLIEGMIIARLRGRREPRRSSTSAASTQQQADILERRARRGRGGRLPRRADPRLRALARPRRAPRRRRLHLRRGDRAARLARGQARQPAPEAAVPGHPGPLPGPDADQQRRDADERPDDHRDGRRGVREDRHRDLDRHEGRLGLGQRPAARATTRSSSASRRARSSSASPAARRAGREVKALVPGRLVARRCCTDERPRPAVRLRLDGEGRLDARLRRDHRRRRLACRSSTSR